MNKENINFTVKTYEELEKLKKQMETLTELQVREHLLDAAIAIGQISIRYERLETEYMNLEKLIRYRERMAKYHQYETKIIGFSGSRTVNTLTQETIDMIKEADVVVHGGAIGYDNLVDKYARSLGKKVLIIRPFDPSNKRDYIARNHSIVSISDKMCFQQENGSRGTQSTINMWRKKKAYGIY